MWILMKPHLALFAIWCAIRLITAQLCPIDDKPINWNLRGNESSRPVDHLNPSLINASGSDAPRLLLRGENFKGYSRLILLAFPRDENYPPCPSVIGKNKDLRRHRCTIYIPENAKSFNVSFDQIMSGCFYVVIINDEGTYWQLDPVFYETNYTYTDTKLKFEEVETKPERGELSRELHPVIKVPLRCLQVIATLYEFEREVANATVYAKNEILPVGGNEQQTCTIFYNGNHKPLEKNCGGKNTNLTIDAYLINEGKQSWTAKIIWTNLRRGGNTYYLTFSPVLVNECLDFKDIYSWQPIDPIIFYGGYYDESDVPPQTWRVNIPLIIGISCSLLGLIVMGMMVYWKWRCSRFMINRGTENNEESITLQTFGSSFDGKESNQILILYVKGPPLLKKAIRNLKDCLKRKCTCYIRDVYELNKRHDIAALGATEWVEQQLKAGTKVVWIDTPELRSLLNDKDEKYNGDDFCDEVLPHAVNLIKPLFQDAQTQYRRHFVVRIKGFEVDDRQADPLQTVTPHVRYNIPDHLADLCEHLNRFLPGKTLENRSNNV